MGDVFIGTPQPGMANLPAGLEGDTPPPVIPGSSSGVFGDSTTSSSTPPPVPSFGNTPILTFPSTGNTVTVSTGNPTSTQSGDIYVADGASPTTGGSSPTTGGLASFVSQTSSGTPINWQQVSSQANDSLNVVMGVLTNPNAPVNQAAMNLATQSAQQQQETIGNLIKFISAQPESPTKNVYLNLLQQIGQALNTIMEALSAMQMKNNAQSQASAQAKMDAAQDQYDNAMAQLQNQEQQQSAQSDHSHMDAMGWVGFAFSMLFQLVTAVVLTICVPVAGAIAAAVLIANVVDSCMKQAGCPNGVWGAMFQAINQGVQDPGLKQFLTIAITGFLLTALVATGSILLGGGDAFTNILMASGLVPASMQSTVMLALTITFAALQLIVSVALCFVPGMQAKALEMIGQIVDLVKQIANTVGTSMKSINIIRTVAEAVVTAVNTAATITETVKNVNFYNKMSQLATQLGALEQQCAELEALLSVLKKLIMSLGNANADISSFLSAIQQFQQQKYIQAGNAMDPAFNLNLPG